MPAKRGSQEWLANDKSTDDRIYGHNTITFPASGINNSEETLSLDDRDTTMHGASLFEPFPDVK